MDYCSDTFGAVVDIGPGSPTGVCFGYGAKFPARYQNAFFACDWSYGKLYAVHLKPKGSTYQATFEEFASAKPFPITDLLINPADGAMYIAFGGRRVQSGLYRLTYVGDESTAPAKPVRAGESERKARRSLEKHLQEGAKVANSSELDRIWVSLGSDDRGIRHAARAALEKQPVKNWMNRLADETDPVISTAAMIALARVDAKGSASAILAKATSLDYAKTRSFQTRLDLLRSVTLTLTRGGQPKESDKIKLIKWLDGIYPAGTRMKIAIFPRWPLSKRTVRSGAGNEIAHQCIRAGGADWIRPKPSPSQGWLDTKTARDLLQMVCTIRELPGWGTTGKLSV